MAIGRDILGTDWTPTRQQVYDTWDQFVTWVQNGTNKRNPSFGAVGRMHKVVDAVRALEALGRIPVGSGDLVEQFWQDMIAHTEEDLGSVAIAAYVARGQALFKNPIP